MNSLPAALPLPGPQIPVSHRPRWGVLGTGWIADKFVTALQKHSSQRIAAVGSRSLDSATEFARRFGIEQAHGSYEELRPTQASTSCTSQPPTTRICPIHC